jgi:O-antigen polysaccharide polymerase Wzy
VDIVRQPGTEAKADLIVKWTLALLAATCLWLNYPLDADAHFVLSHLAVVGLFTLVPCLVFYRPRMMIRKPWGTTSDLVILTALLVFIAIRTLQSVGNQFFVGQASKIVLIVIGWICFKSLDPNGKLLRFVAVLLPGILALGIATGVLIWTVSGKIGAERLRIGPNDYEYVSEYAGLMLPLILFSLDEIKQKKQRIFLFAILTTVLIGLMLTGARGPLIGSVIVILSYGYLARKRLSKAVLIFTISSFAIVFLLLGSIAYTTGSPDDTSRLSFDENSSLESFSSGRWSNWVFLTEEMISDNTWIVFGSGLGRLAEWIPSDGGYYRPAVTNGLLSAWVPFGIVGVFGYLYFNVYLWRRITGMEQSAYRCMAISMFLAYIVTDQFETHWQGTNMLWYVSFILYLLTLARPPLVSATVLKRYKLASPARALAHQ